MDETTVKKEAAMDVENARETHHNCGTHPLMMTLNCMHFVAHKYHHINIWTERYLKSAPNLYIFFCIMAGTCWKLFAFSDIFCHICKYFHKSKGVVGIFMPTVNLQTLININQVLESSYFYGKIVIDTWFKFYN